VFLPSGNPVTILFSPITTKNQCTIRSANVRHRAKITAGADI